MKDIKCDRCNTIIAQKRYDSGWQDRSFFVEEVMEDIKRELSFHEKDILHFFSKQILKRADLCNKCQVKLTKDFIASWGFFFQEIKWPHREEEN